MTPAELVIGEIRAISSTEKEKGDRFEELMLHAFRTDRTFQQQFAEVWLWAKWPGRTTSDIGIDLVARTHVGELVAIQCKCYDPATTLNKVDIDSFISESSKAQWARRIVVSTTDKWSKHAEEALDGHTVPIERLGVDHLDAMTVDWSSYDVSNPTGLVATARHELRPHQVKAVDAVRAGFQTSSRGKLIMACGTGKTFTALRIAELEAGPGRRVLFLAPSIALVAQSLKEWTAESRVPIRAFAVCSDATAGRSDETDTAAVSDVVVPATTDPSALIDAGVAEPPADAMTVVFATYQSIEVVAAVQAATGLEFDLVVCDEAHRTAGVASLDGEDKVFALVHDNSVVPAASRLYMTATPKLFKPSVKDEAAEKDAVLVSMDDEEYFGPEFHRLGFGEAVELGLLADYRVLILAVDEKAISKSFQRLLSEGDGVLSLPDVARFVGCLTALAKLPGGGQLGFGEDDSPMQRAVAFWSSIAESERFADQFEEVANEYFEQLAAGGSTERSLGVLTRHVDGTQSIASRRGDIRWLKESPADGECRVLTNARCLTEGVDVPALDAVMFLTPRRSTIDIVQAVGRVMRKPPGKQLGYVILPIAIPAGSDPTAALNKNKDYDAVWEVLQALRAHDERFNAHINQIALGAKHSGEKVAIEVVGGDDSTSDEAEQLAFDYQDWTDAIYAKIVAKVGSRTYWEDWAKDVADIAARQRARIDSILDAHSDAAEAFDEFLADLKSMLNAGITRDDAVSMVSQHLITRPIFEALFGDDEFAQHNPVARSMEAIVETLDSFHLDTETASLEDFYASVRRRVEGISPDDAHARQTIIKDLYGRFFKLAFPKVADSLGIVYTPVEVVDFIVRAVQATLTEYFDGASISDPGVHVIDPFTGTGTFVTRLLQSGFIRPEDLHRKFTEELHANELLLLAYYIAAVNIELTYRQIAAEAVGTDSGYQPFPGIVLTDTFQMDETGDGTGTFDVFGANSQRALQQRQLDIRVILGNPPYSAGQESANDNNANVKYPKLDSSIAATYVKRSKATLSNSMYDSYIRAIRWASNRVLGQADGGVVAFVTNGGFVDSTTADGMRLSLTDDFHHIYVFNLRGNARGGGDLRQREGGNVFDAGSRATVAITLLVKQAGAVPDSGAVLHYRDIGDYLSRDAKLRIIDESVPSSAGAASSLGEMEWNEVTPNDHGDWINQRSEAFGQLLAAAPGDGPSVFGLATNGLKTNRDAWNYNSSRSRLDANVERMIEFYNSQVAAFETSHPNLAGTLKQKAEVVKQLVDLDPKKFSWDRANFSDIAAGRRYGPEDRLVLRSTYRPFFSRWVEAGRRLNNTVYQIPRVFPDAAADNLVIGCAGRGGSAPFTPFASNLTPDLVAVGAGNAMQFFPRYVYTVDSATDAAPGLFDEQDSGGAVGGRRHNVTDEALATFRELDPAIDKDEIFFYVYGVMHSAEYREVFAADLKKSLPRLPIVDSTEDFWDFCTAGRELAHLHTEYEEVEPWPGLSVEVAPGTDLEDPATYRVSKMRHPKIVNSDDPKARKVDDRSRIIFNEHITISGIPEGAYGYELGSRSAIGWVMESWQLKTDKDSGIPNDPNDWASEHGEPRYVLDLVGRVISVAMRTLDIVEALPGLDL